MSESKHTERSHSIMGTSRAGIYLNCTGYFSAIKDLPPEEKTDDSAKGTLFHECMETVMADFLEHKLTGTDPEISYPKLKANPEIDGEMWDCIEQAKKDVWEKGFEKSITGKAYGFEEEFYLAKVGDIKIGGALDVWSVWRDKKGMRVGLDLDYKYGYTLVDAAKSKQLWCSAVALYEEFKKLGKTLDVVRAVIYQPRAGGEAWKEVKFTAQTLEMKKQKFLRVAEEVFVQGKTKFKAGNHCEWCPARGKCATRQTYLSDQSGLQLIRSNVSLPKAESLTTEQIEKVLTYKDDISNFLKACYSVALRQQMKKPFLKNFKIVEGCTKRKFKKDVSSIKDALVTYGVKEPLRAPVDELKTIGDIEKELKKVGKNKEETENILSHLTERGVAPQILVPISDNRVAVESYRDKIINDGDDD